VKVRAGGTLLILDLRPSLSAPAVRTYQEDLVNATEMDELYGYDTLHRLTSFDRGDLNANKDGIVGTPAREQARQPAAGKPGRSCACGTLDVIGNWD